LRSSAATVLKYNNKINKLLPVRFAPGFSGEESEVNPATIRMNSRNPYKVTARGSPDWNSLTGDSKLCNRAWYYSQKLKKNNGWKRTNKTQTTHVMPVLI